MPELQVQGSEQLADWVETGLLTRGAQQLGLDALHSLAEAEIATGPAAIGSALGVMRRRQQLLGDEYPFEVNPVAVRGRPGAESLAYSALLLLSPGSPARQLLHPHPTEKMAEVFENITALAASRLLGSGAQAVRFGWPSRIGRPPEFYDAIGWLASRMGINAGNAYRPPRRKDGGVDVVAWRPFPDRRSGFPVMLVQCTVQGDILAKAADIDVRYWAGWLTLDSEPLTALAIPHTIPSGVIWDEIAVRTLILERVRISGLVEHEPDVDGFAAFVRDEIASLREILGAAER